MSSEVIEQTEALTFSSERFESEVYADVARLARLREVRLVDGSYNAKVGKFLAAENDADAELRQAFSGEPAQLTFSVERGIVAGTYRWSAVVKSGRLNVLKLSAEYLVLYSGLKDSPEEYVHLYFRKVARFTSYPYFRSHFASHVAASGLMLAPLPSLTERMD